MTAFVAFCSISYLRNRQNFFTFVKVPILLLIGSVRVRFEFGDFSSGSGSAWPNQKILVRSTTTFQRWLQLLVVQVTPSTPSDMAENVAHSENTI